jgi:iron complex outermembrane receptor protein
MYRYFPAIIFFAVGLTDSAFSADELVISAFRDTGPERLATSITVLGSDVIGQSSVQHFEELIQLVPNLNYSGDGNRARYFQVRGIGELEQYAGAPNPSVGFIIDDIDLSGLGSAATLFDADQVDVLRGPQGTRFGANALAGLIFVKSADPAEKFESRLEVTAGSHDTYALGGMLSGPVGDSAGYRLALQKYESDGFQRNNTLGRDDTNGIDELTARVKLHLNPSDNWQIDLTGMYADIDDGYDAWAVDNNGSVTFSDKPGKDAQETAAGSARVTGSFGDVLTFVSITSLANTDSLFSFDADWGSDAFWDTPQYGNSIYDYFSSTTRERDTISQEFRLVSAPAGKLFGYADWIVGIYGLDLDEGIDVVDFGRDDFFCLIPCVTPFTSEFDSKSRAVFGELTVPLGKSWQLDLGLRLESWQADYKDAVTSFSPDDDLWGGHVNLSYQVTDATLIYSRIARGFKAGGFNLDANAPPEKVLFAAETLWNYELGIKYLSKNRTLRADLIAFVMSRDDMQVKVPVQDVAGNPIAFSFLTDNAQEGRNQGVEASVNWHMTESWSVFGTLGLLDADIQRFDYSRDLEGRAQAHAPAYNFSLGTTWQPGQGWFARVDVTGQDEFYYDYSHDQKSQAYEQVNLRLGKSWRSWSVYFWGRNVFDESYTVRGFYFGNEPPDFPDRLYEQAGKPRQVGLTLDWTFQ